MRLDREDLESALRQAIIVYDQDPARAVRSGEFINQIHLFCARELARRGLSAEYLVPNLPDGGYLPKRSQAILDAARRRIQSRLRASQHEQLRALLEQDLDRIEADARRGRLRILGGYLQKEIDVCYLVEDTGPLLAISVKSQMSSIAKNAINRFEEYVGDATNLHTRYPLLVLGFLLVIPVTDETFDQETGEPRELMLRIQALLEQATGRRVDDYPGSYDASSLLVVDFTKDPPLVHPSFPAPDSPLRVERFFDDLLALYQQRNRTLS